MNNQEYSTWCIVFHAVLRADTIMCDADPGVNNGFAAATKFAPN